jgi:hypothetical protein
MCKSGQFLNSIADIAAQGPLVKEKASFLVLAVQNKGRRHRIAESQINASHSHPTPFRA